MQVPYAYYCYLRSVDMSKTSAGYYGVSLSYRPYSNGFTIKYANYSGTIVQRFTCLLFMINYPLLASTL